MPNRRNNHSYYKLTRLEGRFDDINLERSSPHSAIALNGGDDNLFKTAYTQQSWFGWFVDAAYGNAVFQSPGNYDVFATQDALIARPTTWLTAPVFQSRHRSR